MKTKYFLLLPLLPIMASTSVFAQTPMQTNPSKPPMANSAPDVMPANPSLNPRPHRESMSCEIRDGKIKETALQLHDSLKLKPEQEPAWTKFWTNTLSNLNPLGKECDMRIDHKVPLPERLDMMANHEKTMFEVLSTEKKYLAEFYTVLTPEQKENFESFKPRHSVEY